VVAVLAISVAVVPATASAASSDPALHQARQDLRGVRAHIRAQTALLRTVQHDLNDLATRISRNRSVVGEADARIDGLTHAIAILERRRDRIRTVLGERNRAAYILGPTAPTLYLLTATSPGDAAARLSIVSEMNRRDEILAGRLEWNDQRLDREREQLLGAVRARALALRELAEDRTQLRRILAASRRASRLLNERRERILSVISRLHPFAVCPVAGPVAIADDFGIWVHHPENQGGDHVHQGNDMMAAFGTPIVAPFDGTAVVATNPIGGLAVKVFGEHGYVYNAHLSRFGRLGAVHAGDVIGYVGNTGNTDANHDHFEWHPADGPAVDPHAFLLSVC
jgi:murein DD-endopeptidase MepM/ murein hydrolase activator NlpD